MKLRFIIDYATNEATIALYRDTDCVFNTTRLFTARQSAEILPWILEQFKQHAVALQDVDLWMSGIGPGSFTGLRNVSAMTLGLSRGAEKNAPCKGVPSAIGTAAASQTNATRCAVIYDGRNKELLYYGLAKDDAGNWKPTNENGVIAQEAIAQLNNRFPHLIAHQNLQTLLAPWTSAVEYVSQTQINAMAFSPYTESITHPIYLRPAVFTEPKTIREV